MLYVNNGRSVFEYVLRKCKSLLVPFWWWNLSLYPVYFILYYWKTWDIQIGAKEIGEIILTLNKVPFLGATWFLASLFWISVLVHIFITCYFGRDKWCDGLLLILGGVVAILGFQVTFPYKISRTLICAFYYIAGYLFQKYIRTHISSAVSCALAIVFVIIYVIIVKNNYASLGSNVYDSKVLFFIGAFLAIYFMVWISEVLSNVCVNTFIIKHIIYLGENSIDVVIWHFVSFRIAIIIQIAVAGANIGSVIAFPVYDSSGLWWAVYLLSGIYGSLLWKFILAHNPFSECMRRLYMIR